DQEGGRVQRLRSGASLLPAARAYGALHDRQGGRYAEAVSRAAGWLMASELRALGMDLSFAPVLDLDSGCSGVIGDRAFHGTPAVASRLAGAFAAGMHGAGMRAVGKHFPGHGSVRGDSHLLLPEDERPIDEIRDRDLLPFARLAGPQRDAGGAFVDALMTAHVRYSSVDSLPPTYSSYWLQQELRTRIGFSGAIISDDLSMQGAADLGDMGSRVDAALDAGCELLLVCNDRPAAIAALERLSQRGRLAPDCDWSRLAPFAVGQGPPADVASWALSVARELVSAD
ncbi:MAG: beta-N-acetylhexosaminidase, partial [Gammaproteobacteria bacterium]|nr:beta-N-acetylhexosaminidase [Gammaproteobacteria bacterium]